MSTKRQRAGGKWEFIVKNKRLLGKPWSMTFDDEAEGDKYCAHLEALLARNIVPDELKVREPDNRATTLNHVIRDYFSNAVVSESDISSLGVTRERHGVERLSQIDYRWVQGWISGMKRDLHLSPTTIKHHVGALARCFDWAGKDGHVVSLSVNPVRMLPKKYAAYTDADARHLKTLGKHPRQEQERDRRLESKEETAIRAVLSGAKPEGRQRAFELNYQAALELLFELGLETAMRMSEMYTLLLDQVDVKERTVFLDKTKNGTKRQVPLTTVAVRAIKSYMAHVKKGTRGMKGFNFREGLLFPWWSGERGARGEPTKQSKKKTTNLLTRQFKRAFDAAGCSDFNFHDLRHEATSRLYERTQLTDLQIAKITGHKDLRVLMRYANLRPSSLAKQLW